MKDFRPHSERFCDVALTVKFYCDRRRKIFEYGASHRLFLPEIYYCDILVLL